MPDASDRRGILYPSRLPSFQRVPAPAHLEALVRWFWIPRWQIAPGRISRQQVLPFPASNLVVMPEGIDLYGPTTGITHRDLVGEGWAVGALLRPAGAVQLHTNLAEIRDSSVRIEAPALHRDVALAMAGSKDVAKAVEAYESWLTQTLAEPDATGLLANQMEDVIATDRSIQRVEQVAERLNLTVRTVQRLASRHIGVSPIAIIRRYRLQEAAGRLREDASLKIADLAAELGYADHAHLTTDFRKVLGLTPDRYRRDES
ncbi:MAG: helix-turn-helix domain-containing protein [Gulosibacter sp.]|uniref:AraC family transcriptional regulator n=1 Tax=Gulosibacter sp. TaxID=2817531 RepID=UPI003F927B11